MSTRRPASRLATPVPAENGSSGDRNSVVLGPRDRLVGQLFIEGDLRVSGTVEGTLEATGDIEISGAGKVNGDVTAYNRLTVGSDASLIAGDVRVARLTVQDGAQFSGKVSMGKRGAAPKAEEPKSVVPEPAVVAVASVVEVTPVIETKPVAIAPKPVAIAPKPMAVAPKPVAVAQKPVAVAPKPPTKPVQQPLKPAQQKGKRR